MNKVELYLAGVKVDLDKDIDFVLNKTFSNLQDLTSIVVDYSKSINIPMTPSNNRLFNNIYKLDHQVTVASSISYDPSKKIDMVMTYNADTVLEGYAVLSEVDINNKTYEINLYGQLGKIFSILKNKTIADYSGESKMFSIIKMDRNNIKQSWDSVRTGDYLSWDSTNWTDFFGFAPQMVGNTKIMDTTAYETMTGTVVKFEDEVKEQGQYAEREYLVKDGLDINQYGEVRSYMTRPYVYVDKMVQLIQNEINNGQYDGYKMTLDSHFFNQDNPYYSKMVFFSGSKNAQSDERSLSGSVEFNGEDYNITTIPQNLIPTYDSTTTGDYKITETGGLFSIELQDGGSFTGNASFSGTVKMTDSYMDPTVVNTNILYAYYRRYGSNLVFPIPYLGVYDENDNLIYRLCLCGNAITYITQLEKTYAFTDAVSGVWGVLKNLDERNIVPAKSRQNTTASFKIINRNQEFDFDTMQLQSKFRFRFSIMSVNFANGTFVADNVSPDDVMIPFARSFSKDTQIGYSSFARVVNFPLSVKMGSESYRSGADYNITNILGADFNPFSWLMTYVKMFRLGFDVDYLNRTITVTDGIFDNPEYKKVVVDYSKDFKVEPIANNYSNVVFGYGDNPLSNGILYKKKYGIEYGDLDILTGIEIGTETMKLTPDTNLKVFIPSNMEGIVYNDILTVRDVVFRNIWGTNKIINTLNEGGDIQYFPFFAFRDDNIQSSQDIRITDDTLFQSSQKKYYYLSQNAQPAVSTRTIPQFDNWININGTIYWALFNKPMVVYNGNVDSGENVMIFDNWKHYLDELFNINNKKVTCYIRMTYPEFINYRFNQLLVIDNSVFLCNKIIDFNPASQTPTKVELIQVSNSNNL